MGDPVNNIDPEETFVVPLVRAIIKFGKKAWDAGKKLAKDVDVDGPKGTRVCGIRYKNQPIARLDYGAYKGTHGENRLHLHLDKWFPGTHIPVDPRSVFD